jgi:hypothetical protein
MCKKWVIFLVLGIGWLTFIMGLFLGSIGQQNPAWENDIGTFYAGTFLTSFPLILGMLSGYFYSKEVK